MVQRPGANLPYWTSLIVYFFTSATRSSTCQPCCGTCIPQGHQDSVIQPDKKDSDSPCYTPPDIVQENWQHRQPELDGLNTRNHPHKPLTSLNNQHPPADAATRTSHNGIDSTLQLNMFSSENTPALTQVSSQLGSLSVLTLIFGHLLRYSQSLGIQAMLSCHRWTWTALSYQRTRSLAPPLHCLVIFSVLLCQLGCTLCNQQ